jgi:uncharacterized protein (TIGR02996 family)
MTLEDLRAAVLADPDADEPRLVLADALLERGDHQGELIRVQIALARDPDQPTLMRREEELLTPLQTEDRRYRRGLVEDVGMIGRVDRELLRSEPIRSLRVRDADEALLAAGRDGLLARIEGLAVPDQSAPAVRQLAEIGALPRLRRLSIIDGVSPVIVELVPLFPGLRGIGLPGARRYGGPVGRLDHILAVSPPLDWLDLRRRPGYPLMDDLFAWERFDELVELRWDGTRADHLARAGAALRSLLLDEAEATLLNALADGPAGSRLERIRAAEAPLRTSDELAALRPGSFPRLRELALGGVCRLRRPAIAALLAAAPRLGRLTVQPADVEARALLAEHDAR